MSATSQNIKKFNWWYDAIIDWMLQHPEGTMNECAKAMNCSFNWLSIVRNSDMFKERFAERRSQVNEMMAAALVEKTTSVALKSLTLIEDRLENQTVEKTKLPTLIEIADKSLARLGYGAPKGGTTVNVNTAPQVGIAASQETILEARKMIRSSQAEIVRETAIEGEIIEEQPDLFDRGPAASPSPMNGNGSLDDLSEIFDPEEVELVAGGGGLSLPAAGELE